MRAIDHQVGTCDTPTTASFNYNKLQAAACILASSAVSIGLAWLAVTRLF